MTTSAHNHRNERDERRAARRTGWLLGLTVIGIYVGYIAWNFWRAAGSVS